MKEWIAIGLMSTGGICFAVGGTGYKWVRRFVMPITMAILCLTSGIAWWKCLCFTLSAIGAFTLGYGESLPYWRKALTFSAYSIVTLWIGFTWWQIIMPLLCLSAFKLSNIKRTSSTFEWKICEFIIGVLFGITLSCIILK